MLKHWKYLRYVVRHKWFVFQEGRKLGVPLWQLIVHDWSKFLPDEWRPYATYFYGKCWHCGESMSECGAFGPEAQESFDVAWLKHIHRSPHHWQYWVLREDSGNVKVLPMPDRYRREMLADWRGAGRAIHGKDETAEWYINTRKGRLLHPVTEKWVEEQLGLGIPFTVPA